VRVAVTTSEIPVEFHGEGSGTGKLTWGQAGIWETIRRTGRTLNIGGTLALPAGSTAEEMAGVLRFSMSRHQALRTLLVFDRDDPDAQPLQRVVESGRTALAVLDVDGDDDPAEVAEDVRMRYETAPFDYAAEWPVRMAVVRRGGAATHLVVQYCHLSVDGGGIEALVRNLAHMDPETGEGRVPVRGVRPLDLARLQASVVGRRHSEKSLRYWEGLLGSIPAERFTGVPDPQPDPDRFREAYCYSPAILVALRAIAARTGADTSTIVLAAYAISLARVTGQSPSVAQTVVSNRFRPGFGEAVAHLSQVGICAIDVAGCTFDQAVKRAFKAATGAFMHGYFDSRDHTELLRRVEAERGEAVDISCYVNDRRVHPAVEPGEAPPTPEELREALALTRLRWDRTMPAYDGELYLHLDSQTDGNVPGRDIPEETGRPAVYLSLWGDTHRISPADLRAFAEGFEAVLVEAAFDGTVPTGVGVPEHVVVEA
jgi:hypothetical protein